uniref:Heat shock protein family A (Hsp70) member 12A.2 n=1 Tax=Poecilia mexicana TaxID=48701 RepID=A0A3B3XGS2_9TELE
MGEKFVIAIDFGTAYSGYAFSIAKRDEESQPYVPRWGREYGFDSPKTPTCILFNEYETCLSFGYEAKMAYKEMGGEEAKKYYYFEYFKMVLDSKAGIVAEGGEEKLVIALEPEAASIWCKNLPSEGFISEKHNEESLDQSAGTQYIVVDCGGGTIDFTVHEVLGGGALKERHKASGNDLGGQTVDRKFMQFLREIFPEGVWDEFEQNSPSAAQRMMYDFTYLKQSEKDVQISCPFALGKLAKEKSDTENFVKSELGASWDGDFIKISRDKMRSFYDESLQGITENLMEIFTSGLNIKYILLVGGYAQSKVLQQHITDQFGHQCKVLCPFRAQEAILRGAVEFGRNPNVVASRKSSYTYGFAVCEKFDESKHKKEKKFTAKGVELSRDIFRKLVEEGEDLGSEKTRKFLCSSARADQKQIKLRFYSTFKKNPVYIDDSDVEEEGSFTLDITEDSKVKLEIKIGSTEIVPTVINLTTGEKKQVKIDLMTTDRECVIDDDSEDDVSVGSSFQSEEYILDGAD